jgi:hypothetical protein
VKLAGLLLALGDIVLQREDFLEKDDLKKMEAKLLLSLPEGLEMTQIEVIDGVLTISAVSTQKSACCPPCSSLGMRVHGHYTRTIADLPVNPNIKRVSRHFGESEIAEVFCRVGKTPIGVIRQNHTVRPGECDFTHGMVSRTLADEDGGEQQNVSAENTESRTREALRWERNPLLT